MINKWLLPIILFIVWFNLKADAPVEIRRICKNGRNNSIYFYPSSDTCSIHFQYKIWGRNGLVGPFLLLDSISVKNTDQYIHIEANPGIATNWSYYIVITDSCGPDYQTYSDTVSVDEEAPVSTFLDSVSVNPLTNRVQIGWSSNPSPDFAYYIVYKDSLGNYLPVFNNSKDTFTIDNRASSNPANQPLKYDISTVDSCDNRKIFNINPHTTIWLRQTTDSCARKTTLTWTPYIGWNRIKMYHIYRQTGTGPYVLIDSVTPPVISYTDDIVLGDAYRYFIRAVKDTIPFISSSSNSVPVQTRLRVEPSSSYISAVSVISGSDISVRIYNPSEEVKRYDIVGSDNPSTSFTYITSINAVPLRQNYEATIPLSPDHKLIKATAFNACNESFPTTNTSRFITLKATGQTGQNTLSWETYFTWNIGIDYYRIYRGTNNTFGEIAYTLLDSVSALDSNYIDSILPPIVGENGLCYYVEAVQRPGDINGGIETAMSTRACIVGEMIVYIPNAFRPTGVNRLFRPEGSYIDYTNSSMEIYDRWGARIIEINNIRTGWDGKDASGVSCTQGVYFYKILIKSTNGKEKNFNGFITLLD
jgi:gliding motility-associated-like protein